MKAIPEFHQQGTISFENLDIHHMEVNGLSGFSYTNYDLGVQVAADGRVWICINGIAFLRFSPHLNGRMSKEAEQNSG